MPDDKHHWRGFLILLLIAVLGTYLGEQLPPLKVVGTGLWSPVQAALNWLVAPALVSRGLLVFSVLLTWLAAGYFNKRAAGAPVVAPEAAPVVAPEELQVEDFEPTRVQLISARVLIECYAKRLQLPDLAAGTTRYTAGGPLAIAIPVAPQGEIARQMEDLQRRGVAIIVDPDTPMTYYGLTRHGRDFMLEKLRPPARRPPPPAVDPTSSALRALQDMPKEPPVR